MKWEALDSKMLSAVTYDDSGQILYLRFRNTGHVYRYFDFPAADHQAFLSRIERPIFPLLHPRPLPLRAHGQPPRRLNPRQPALW